jgi:tRNA (guanine-N7-)-methyltransferase
MDRLQDNCLDRCFVLFPDPWPKARHHKRRMIRKENLDRLARLMKKGAVLELATDVPPLAEWMLEEGLAHPEFEWTAQSADDWRCAPKDWVATRYQEKAQEQGRKPYFIQFIRR